jgi:ATP-dependent RNA helicase SUPV3L1/SUV3
MRSFVRDWVESLLKPLHHVLTDRLANSGRGIMYQLEQGLGSCFYEDVREQVTSLSEADRSRFGRLGIRIGQRYLFVRSLLSPAALEQRRLLCGIEFGKAFTWPSLGAVGSLETEVSERMYLAMGYGILEDRVVRVDALELAWIRVHAGIKVPQLAQLIGCNDEEARFLLHALRPRHPTKARMKRAS